MTQSSLPGEPWNSLSGIMAVIRSGEAKSRPEIERVTGLGRSIVTERVADLVEKGLVVEDTLGPSTGGRPAKSVRINPDAGFVLVASYGVHTRGVGVADATGRILRYDAGDSDIAQGPDAVLTELEALFDELIADFSIGGKLWGIGIGLPGPVENESGKPVTPPMMPGWDGYDIRRRLETRFGVPVRVDNDVNLMALGEMRDGAAKGADDFLFIKAGTGIGVGFVSNGRLHRGAQGMAGDIGHSSVDKTSTLVCRCGRLGCLETVAGGVGVMRDARAAVLSGRSDILASHADDDGNVALASIMTAADHGDRVAVDLLVQSGAVIGRLLGTLVGLFNPAVIVVGGTMSTNEVLISAVRRAVHEWAQPLATRELRIVRSLSQEDAAGRGAVYSVLDTLFTPRNLPLWWEANAVPAKSSR